jgi:hypothetical protein
MAAWIGAVPKHNHNAWVVTRFIKEAPLSACSKTLVVLIHRHIICTILAPDPGYLLLPVF